MPVSREHLEYESLSILSQATEPIGSLALNLTLRERDLTVSAATVGRLLSDFDFSGYTIKQGYKGRLITEKGTAHLSVLRGKFKWQDLSERFYEMIDAQSKDNLLDILTARRGIERETARLAALHATAEDIAKIQSVMTLQREQITGDTLTFESDRTFHRAIAAASKNNVLAAAYDFVWIGKKYSHAIEYIRTYVGGQLVTDHGKILSAIISKNPEQAELAMIDHIDSLIADVNQYWDLSVQSQ